MKGESKSFSLEPSKQTGRSKSGEIERIKKSSADGSFGVAQSPKRSNDGTRVMVAFSHRGARGVSKIIQKNSFSLRSAEKTEKMDLPTRLLPIRGGTHSQRVVLEPCFLEVNSATHKAYVDKGPNDRSNPTILSLPSRIGGLCELPKFCKRFRLPTECLGAHHRGTKGRGKQTTDW